MRMPQPEAAVQQGHKDRLLSSLASEPALAGGVPERYLDNMTRIYPSPYLRKGIG